jgi:hypothetical protein
MRSIASQKGDFGGVGITCQRRVGGLQALMTGVDTPIRPTARLQGVMLT